MAKARIHWHVAAGGQLLAPARHRFCQIDALVANSRFLQRNEENATSGLQMRKIRSLA